MKSMLRHGVVRQDERLVTGRHTPRDHPSCPEGPLRNQVPANVVSSARRQLEVGFQVIRVPGIKMALSWRDCINIIYIHIIIFNLINKCEYK